MRQYRLIEKPGFSISPSSINTYMDCPYKWALTYICGIRMPSGEAAIQGGEIHNHVDKWYRSGTMPPDTKTGRVACVLLSHLPANHEKLVSESKHYIDFGSFAYLQGTSDLLDYSTTIVHDHKSTSNLKWAKSPHALQTDPQAIVYTLIGQLSGMDSPSISWNYITRAKKPQFRRVETKIVDLPEKMDYIANVAEYLTSLKMQNIDPKYFPKNLQSCHKYGGCDYGSMCERSSIEKLQAAWDQ